MKRINVLAVLFVLFISTSLSAQAQLDKESAHEAKSNFSVELTNNNTTSRLNLKCENPDGGRVYVAIENNDQTLWNQAFSERGFTKSFDLSLLDDGEYIFTVVRGKEKIRKTIHLETSTYTLRKQVIQ